MELPPFLTKMKYGDIRLTGHRIDLLHVVDLYKDGKTVGEICYEFDTLSIPLVRQVIEFYLANKSEVDDYVAKCHAEIDRQAAAPRKGPDLAELQRRREAQRRRGA